MKVYNIAIDGPAGAGKSTIAKKIAKRLSYIYIDTGSMYRAIAYYMLGQGIDTKDEEKVIKACDFINVTIEYMNGEQQVILNGENVTDNLRKEEVGIMASIVAKYQTVRGKMVHLQRELAKSSNVIMDGRDIGTVVLPEADLKVFLTASSLVRAKRRFNELSEKGISCNLEEIEQDIIDRDNQDMTRLISPLKQAEDAVLVDTSDMTIDEVVDTIINLFEDKIIR
jgi:cytidylate kinase